MHPKLTPESHKKISQKVHQNNLPSKSPKKYLQRVPALRAFWDLEKIVLHEIRVSGTVLWSPTNANSPTYTYRETCFTATVFDDVASFFFLKVSKIFHKTANSFYVYFFLSLKVQSSQMLKVISLQIDSKSKLLQKSQYWYFLS